MTGSLSRGFRKKILMDLAILRGICSLQAEKTFFHGILGEEHLGGASADAQSYWQGRFAACAFVGDFLGIGRTRNSWGVALNPTRDRRKGTKVDCQASATPKKTSKGVRQPNLLRGL